MAVPPGLDYSQQRLSDHKINHAFKCEQNSTAIFIPFSTAYSRIFFNRIVLKIVDGAKGNGFLKIDSIQLNLNSEHPWNEVGNFVNN